MYFHRYSHNLGCSYFPLIARHTRSGVAGSSICFTSNSFSASTIALATAAGATAVPPSLPGFMPSGLEGLGT